MYREIKVGDTPVMKGQVQYAISNHWGGWEEWDLGAAIGEGVRERNIILSQTEATSRSQRLNKRGHIWNGKQRLGSDLDRALCEEGLTVSKLFWAIGNFPIGGFRSAARATEQIQDTAGSGLLSSFPTPCAKSKFLAEILIASIGSVTRWSTHRITSGAFEKPL